MSISLWTRPMWTASGLREPAWPAHPARLAKFLQVLWTKIEPLSLDVRRNQRHVTSNKEQQVNKRNDLSLLRAFSGLSPYASCLGKYGIQPYTVVEHPTHGRGQKWPCFYYFETLEDHPLLLEPWVGLPLVFPGPRCCPRRDDRPLGCKQQIILPNENVLEGEWE